MTSYTTRLESPLGGITLDSDGESLTGLWFDGSRNEPKRTAGGRVCDPEQPVFHETRRWLDVYFSGRQPDFTPAYRLVDATPFREEVVREMLEIPFGATATYGEIAAKIAKRHGLARMSAQAVGGAVGWNPICLIIPCHRVVGAHGVLTGYGGGIQNKEALLALETRGDRK